MAFRRSKWKPPVKRERQPVNERGIGDPGFDFDGYIGIVDPPSDYDGDIDEWYRLGRLGSQSRPPDDYEEDLEREWVIIQNVVARAYLIDEGVTSFAHLRVEIIDSIDPTSRVRLRRRRGNDSVIVVFDGDRVSFIGSDEGDFEAILDILQKLLDIDTSLRATWEP